MITLTPLSGGDAPLFLHAPDGLEHVDAVHLGHHDIEKQQIVRLFFLQGRFEGLDGLPAVKGKVAEALRLEKFLHQAASDEIIFYNQDAHESPSPVQVGRRAMAFAEDMS